MICEHCREPVRFGWRHGLPGWWHRNDPDHTCETPVVKHEEHVVEPLPPVEVWAHDVDPADFAPRSGIKQVINLIGKTDGWELVSVRHARGPYVGSKGELLSISDTHVVKARGPVGLDGDRRVAVASWRDGKFDFAFTGTIQGGRLSPTKVDATTLKNWIKGKHEPLPPDAATV